METALEDKIKVSRRKDVIAIRNNAHWLTTYGGIVRRQIEAGEETALLREIWRYDMDWSGAQADVNRKRFIPDDSRRRTVLDRAPFRALLPKFFAKVRTVVDECHRGRGIEATRARAAAGPLRLQLFRQSFIATDGLVREAEVLARAQGAGYGADRNLIQDFDRLVQGIEAQREAVWAQLKGDPKLSIFGIKVHSRWLEDMFFTSSPWVSASEGVFKQFEVKRAEFSRVGQALVDAVGRELIDRRAASLFRAFPHLDSRRNALFRVLVIDDFYPLLLPWFDRMGALEPWAFELHSGLPLKLEVLGEEVRHSVDLAAASGVLGLDESRDSPPYHLVLLDIDFGWQGYGDVALAYLEALGKLLPGTPVLMISRWGYLDAVEPYLGSSLDKAAVGFLCKSSNAYVRSPDGTSRKEFDDPSVSEIWRSRIRKTIYSTWNVVEIPFPRAEGRTDEAVLKPGRAILVDVPEEPTLACLPEWHPENQDPVFDDWAFARGPSGEPVKWPPEARALGTVRDYLRAVPGADQSATSAYVNEFARRLEIAGEQVPAIRSGAWEIALLAVQLSDKGGRYLFVPRSIQPGSASVAILVRAPSAHARARDYYEKIAGLRLTALAQSTLARPRINTDARDPSRPPEAGTVFCGAVKTPSEWFKISHISSAAVEAPLIVPGASKWQLIVVLCELVPTAGVADFQRALIHVFKDLHYSVVSSFGALSLFDILGPIMVGPSSSHTAGACRIGRLAQRWLAALSPWLEKQGAQITRSRLDVVMHGSFRTTGEGHGSDIAVLSGLLGRLPSDPIVRLPRYGKNQAGTGAENVRTWFGLPALRNGDKEDGTWPDAGASAWPPCVRFVWDSPGNASLHPNTIRFRIVNREEEGDERELAWLTARSYGGGNVQLSGAGLRMKTDNNVWRMVETDLRESDLNDRKAMYGGLREVSVVCQDGHLGLKEPTTEGALLTIQPTRMTSAMNGAVPKLVATLFELSIPSEGIAPIPIWKQALEYEESVSNRGADPVRGLSIGDSESNGGNQIHLEPELTVRRVLAVMLQSIIEGLSGGVSPVSLDEQSDLCGTSQGVPDDLMNALKISKHRPGFDHLNVGWRAYSYSVAVQEQNANNGRIVAAPTAGACGIMPGALFAVAFSAAEIEELRVVWQDLESELKRSSPEAVWVRWRANDAEERDKRLKRIEDALLTAAMVGLIINNIVPTSGSSHGCQAETGIGAAMAAAAVCALLQNRPDAKQILHAATLALKNAIGLTCDPVGGKVEVPCIKRSGMKAVEAIVVADAALSGVTSRVEPDAVVWVLREVGEAMLPKFRETSLGGLAQTPCARCKGGIC